MDRAFEWLRMWVCASCSYLASRPATKQKGDMSRGVERGVSISFYIHTHSHEPDKPECQRKAARSVVRPTSLPSSDARAPLSHHARSRLRVVSRAQKRAGGADDATRRNRHRTRTIHLAGRPAASNGALIRLRQVENQSALLPCLPCISRRRRVVHGANGNFIQLKSQRMFHSESQQVRHPIWQ